MISTTASPPCQPPANIARHTLTSESRGQRVALKEWKRTKHQWFIFDNAKYRLPKAASDLAGMPRHEYNATPKGLLLALMDLFPRKYYRQATIDELLRVHEALTLKATLLRSKGHEIFSPKGFDELRIAGHNEAATIIATAN